MLLAIGVQAWLGRPEARPGCLAETPGALRARPAPGGGSQSAFPAHIWVESGPWALVSLAIDWPYGCQQVTIGHHRSERWQARSLKASELLTITAQTARSMKDSLQVCSKQLQRDVEKLQALV